MSLHRMLIVTRWLERAKPNDHQTWRKHAAAVARRHPQRQPTICESDHREAILQRLDKLLKEDEARVGSSTEGHEADAASESAPSGLKGPPG